MDYIPCRQRKFPFRINVVSLCTWQVKWLRHLSERLGSENAISIWRDAFADFDDKFLMDILSTGWNKVEIDESQQTENKFNKIIDEYFSPNNCVLPADKAKAIIENTPPFLQIKQRFSFNNIEKEMSAYDALHLRFDSLATLAELLIKKYGKEGELIIYDMLLEGRIAANQGETTSVEEFISGFTSESDTNDLYTAGLEIEVIYASDREAKTNVRECEWARYFQEHHPKVGYLISCSSDEAAYKALNKNLRLQRTTTLMEGGKVCDFRVYAVD